MSRVEWVSLLLTFAVGVLVYLFGHARGTIDTLRDEVALLKGVLDRRDLAPADSWAPEEAEELVEGFYADAY